MNEKIKYFLCKIKNNRFACGWQVYKQVEKLSGGTAYKHGDWWVRDEYITKKIPLDTLELDWVELEQPHKPTLFEKVKSLFGIDYDSVDFVRPKSDSVVIVDYDGLIETAEVTPTRNGSCIWVTELYTGIKPKRWAFLPNGLLND